MMKIKSMIPLAASGAIAAMLIGCGSSGSSTTTTTTGSSIQSSVQAVDGYIYNGKVEAFYVMDDNTTMGSVTLNGTNTTKNTSSTAVTVGSSTYTLADSNISIKDQIKFFRISANGSNNDGNVTFTPATYIEADGVDGYDTNDTLLGTNVLYAPATGAIVSPITSLVYLANTATFGSTTAAGTSKADLNASTIAAIDANITKLATNLGLTGVDFLTADPVALATSNPTYKLVNALLLGGNEATATTILGMTTAASTLATTIAAVATALPAGTNAKTLATSLQTLAENGAFTTSDIASLNIEKSVSTGTYTSLEAPTIAGKFPISSILVDGVASSSLSATGAKLGLDGTSNVVVDMSLASSEANVTNTAFSVLVAFKGSKTSVADDSNISTSFVVEIPFELNITSGTVATAGVAQTSTVKFQVKSKDGSEVVSNTDSNASVVGIAAGDISVASDALTIDVENIVTALKAIIDSNTTANSEAIDGRISDVQISLKDSTSAIVGASSATVKLPLARATFSDIGTGSITGVEAYKLLSLSTLDMRGTTTEANAAPTITALAATLAVANISHTTAAGVTTATETASALGSSIIINEGAGDVTNPFTYTLGNLQSELNTSVAISGLPAWVSTTNNDIKNGNDLNITIDGNATVTGHSATMATVKATDEFGKTAAANDANVTFIFNHKPTITAGSEAVALTIGGTTAVTFESGLITDSDGLEDLNASATITPVVTINAAWTDADVVDAGADGTTIIYNSVAGANDDTVTVTHSIEDNGTITWTVTPQAVTADEDGNVTIQYTVTDKYGAQSDDQNITITIDNVFAATSLSTVQTATAGGIVTNSLGDLVNISTIKSITATLTATAAQAATMTGVTGGITLSDATVSIANANIADALFSGAITATIVTDAATTLATLNDANTNNAYALTVNDTAITDYTVLSALDTLTTVTVNAASILTITEVVADITSLQSVDATLATNAAYVVTDLMSTTNATTIAGYTTGKVTGTVTSGAGAQTFVNQAVANNGAVDWLVTGDTLNYETSDTNAVSITLSGSPTVSFADGTGVITLS